MVWEAGAGLEIHVCVGGVSCGTGSRGRSRNTCVCGWSQLWYGKQGQV